MDQNTVYTIIMSKSSALLMNVIRPTFPKHLFVSSERKAKGQKWRVYIRPLGKRIGEVYMHDRSESTYGRQDLNVLQCLVSL